jgi:general secretion pathway protein D
MIVKLLLLLLTALTVEGATITAITPQSSYSSGDFVRIDVSVSNVTDLYAFQFDLSFNPAVLIAQSVTETGYFLSNGVSFFPGLIDNNTGSVSFIGDSLSGSGPGFSGSTILATAIFKALTGTTIVSPSNAVLLDSNLSDIAANTNSATVSITSESATPEPVTSGLLVVGLAILAAFGNQKSKIIPTQDQTD